MTELTEIEGVGPSYAEDLEDAGYETAEDVADADPSDVDDIIPTTSGEEVVSNAQDGAALGEPDHEEPIVETEDDTDDFGPETYTLEPDLSAAQENHLIYALINEEVQARRRNNASRHDDVTRAIDDVKGGEPYVFTYEQVSIAYTAMNQLENEYRGTRGLSTFVSDIRDVAQYFQQKRQEHFEDNE